MNEDEHLERFGIQPRQEDLESIVEILRDETAKERASQGSGDTEVMKLCCVQLFHAGQLEHALAIWRAKTASMDADGSIDIQLLCGSGVENTKSYLATLDSPESQQALSRIEASEASGDFEEFSREEYLDFWNSYYA